MKSAKELFKELGYREDYDYKWQRKRMIKFVKDENIIIFYLKTKMVSVSAIDIYSEKYVPLLTEEEQEVIKKMMKELGWCNNEV